MKVLQIEPDDSYPAIVPADPSLALKVVGTGGFTGNAMAARWELLRFKLAAPERALGDFVAVTSGTFAFSEQVRETFDGLFSEIGEVLPIEIDGVPYSVLNVLRRVDALDLEHSQYTTFAGTKIATVERHAFFPATVSGESIFLVKQRLNVLYCTSGQPDSVRDFYQRVMTRGYRGLEFRQVWTSMP
jgi:hypothetical protein